MNTFSGTSRIAIVLLAVSVSVFGPSIPVWAQASNAAKELQSSFIQVAKLLQPSVVNIRVERSSSSGVQWMDPSDQFPEGSPFDDLFKEFFKRMPNKKGLPKGRSPFKNEAAGSGVVYDEKGTILTNNHVVKGATSILVKFSDGKELKAKIVGQDPQSDLAVIKVEPKTPLQPARFADSDQVEVGQWCIAVGNPLGLEKSVTVGVVSALRRSGIGASPIEDFIQTDASINPGNSGGPLVDLDGKVIGINTLIFAAPGSGIGFAIPSNMVVRVAHQIVNNGSVERPFMGISMQGLTPELAEHFSLEDRSGAVVMELGPDTPAGKAGIKPMDIIRSIDGKTMESTNDVQKFVLSKKVGDTIEVKILRNGKEVSIPVKLERMPKTYGLKDPEDLVNKSGGEESDSRPQNRDLGFTFKPLDSETARSLKLESKEGLVVTEVEEGSTAEEGGLEVQDVITQVNGQPVKDRASLEKAIVEGIPAKKSSVFLVLRDGSPMFLVIPEKSGK